MIIFAAALNLVSLALFVMACRAPILERVRKVERLALLCAVLTLLIVAVDFSLALLALFEAMGSAGNAGVVVGLPERLALLVPLLLAAWLGIVMLRRSRAAAP